MSSDQKTLKFLCSYGGKIIPRPSDGKLRYLGGLTRVLSVPRHITFPELMEKLKDLCGYDVVLRCQLPNEDLDVLVSIKSDEELCHVIEEYENVKSSKEVKVRAILSQKKGVLSSSSSSSSLSSADLTLSPNNKKFSKKPPMQNNNNSHVGVGVDFGSYRQRHRGLLNHNQRRHFGACHLQASHSYHQLPSHFSHHWQ